MSRKTKTSNIVSNQKIEPSENIFKFLDKEFKKRRAKKPFIFYKRIVLYYDEYPSTITHIIKELYSLGYWKDYFMLLLASTNDRFNDMIYNFLIETFIADTIKYKNNENITTLAKWLPREKSGFDKKLLFVDKFCKLLFPEIKNKFTARKEYRKVASMLNKRLNTAEITFCNKKHENLNFEKMGPICFSRNYPKFVDNDLYREKIKNRIYNFYDRYDLWNFVHAILFKKIDDFHKNIILEIWKKKVDTFIQIFDFVDFNYDFLIDLSNNIFQTNAIVYTIAVVLLKSEIIPNSHVFINCRNPYAIQLNGNIFEKISTIFNNCCPSDKILTNFIDSDLVVMSNKTFHNTIFSDKKVIYWDLSFINNNHKPIIKHDKNYSKIAWYPFLNKNKNKNISSDLKKYASREIFWYWICILKYFLLCVATIIGIIYIVYCFVTSL